jgi:hypothetical protein
MFDHYYRGVAYSRPEFLYFWVYYFLLNFIWMIFPSSKLPKDNEKSETPMLTIFCP